MTTKLKRIFSLKRNILLYRLNLIFSGNGLMTSASYFFFTIIKGLSSAETLFLIGFAALATALAEVPTGVIADKFSRKYSILIGISLLIISGLCMLITTGFWSLLILVTIQGIAGSFTSGADDALLYDSLKELGKADDFKYIFNLSQSIDYTSFAVTVLIGGLLASVNLYLPFVANILLLSISFIIVSLLIEPVTTKDGEKIEHVGYLTHMSQSIKSIFSKSGFNSGLLGSFMAFALISATFKSTKNILSPILNEYGVTVSVIGFVITIMTLIKATGSYIASRVKKRMDIKKETIIAMIIFISGLLTIAFVHISLIRIAILILITSLDSIILTNLNTIINERIESNQRSTILSLLSLFSLSSKMMFLTSLGWMIDLYSLEQVLVFVAVWLALPVIILFFFAQKEFRM